MKIALDAMGGDLAPREILLGAVQAKRALDLDLILVGKRAAIEQELHEIEASDMLGLPDLEIVDAPDVIEFDQNPSSVKERRGASIRVICDLVKQQRADACLTMGHTGAGIVASLITFGRLGQVLRPCVGIPYFGLQPQTLLVDAGAMVDCKPEYLAQFARMGAIYVEKIWGIAHPTVGLMTNGREDNKGNDLTRTTFALLKNSELNFIGNLEGYDLPNGTANVVVMDGLWGNVALKMTEGLSEQLLARLAKRFAETGLSQTVHAVMNEFQLMMDYTRIGAIPVFGVDGLMLIGHGRSSAAAVVGGLKSTAYALQVDLLGALRAGLSEPEIT
ncbi:MAG: phosphate acyltransferase PlsX [Chloroflexota bacterium]|nr:MAG: phosphate acyltransferase PlsX [Chloroflexota bacterium]